VTTTGLDVRGGERSVFSLNGLLVVGEALHVPAAPGNQLADLRILHTTLVPGWSLAPDGAPQHGGEPGLDVDIAGVAVTIERTIVGALRVHASSTVSAKDSVVDANGLDGTAFSASDGASAGGALSLDGCTVVGKVHARLLPLVSNSLLLAKTAPGDGWPTPVRAEQRQRGCVRFSWLPPTSRVPRRYRCLPQADGAPAPRMLSLRYGTPHYGRLSAMTDAAILRGADDEGEMGALHHLLAPLRTGNLRLRLDEYLRAGLESGTFIEI
jgi:hypothetical protein